jgi:MFS family permease
MRALQDIATGLATGPTGAALIDLQPSGSQQAPPVTSAFSTLGLALGALITSALAQYAPAPTHLIWWALLAVFAAGILVVLAVAEPGSRRPGLAAPRGRGVAPPSLADSHLVHHQHRYVKMYLWRRHWSGSLHAP